MKTKMNRVLLVAFMLFLFMGVNAQKKEKMSISFSTGIANFSNSSNLSPLGLKYRNNFNNTNEYHEIRLAVNIKKNRDIGFLAKFLKSASYIDDKQLDNQVDISYFAITYKLRHYCRNRFSMNSLLSAGLTTYENNIHYDNTINENKKITSLGWGLAYDFMVDYRFKYGFSIGAKAGVMSFDLYKWKGDNAIIDKKSYNIGDNINRILQWSVGVVITKSI